MAAELELGLNQPQKLVDQYYHLQQALPSSTTPGPWMWTTWRAAEDDDSWEVQAFARDTGSLMGTTWPPRSYTCTFCRREFRSAQALGGHMNVHRRDRARLRQSPPEASDHSSPSPGSSATPLLFQTQELIAAGGGLCLLYPIPSPGQVFSQASMNGSLESPPSTLLSISPSPATGHLLPPCLPAFALPPVEPKTPSSNKGSNSGSSDEGAMEELDLELRLGSKRQ